MLPLPCTSGQAARGLHDYTVRACLRPRRLTPPQLAARNNSPVHIWLTNNCNPDLDIIPTITRLAEKNKAIGGFSYFTTAVMRARDERVKAEETFNPPEKGEFNDHEKAKRIACAVRKAGIRNTMHEAYLAQYEAVHGTVSL